MGVVMVGPSGCGKSTVWRLLRAALKRLGLMVQHHTVNPKALSRQQLLGHMDMDTREWSDGVITAASRHVIRELQGDSTHDHLPECHKVHGLCLFQSVVHSPHLSLDRSVIFALALNFSLFLSFFPSLCRGEFVDCV